MSFARLASIGHRYSISYHMRLLTCLSEAKSYFAAQYIAKAGKKTQRQNGRPPERCAVKRPVRDRSEMMDLIHRSTTLNRAGGHNVMQLYSTIRITGSCNVMFELSWMTSISQYCKIFTHRISFSDQRVIISKVSGYFEPFKILQYLLSSQKWKIVCQPVGLSE